MTNSWLFSSAVSAVGDVEGTRTVTAIVVLLAGLGVMMLMIAVWLFKITRPDPELLAPLEVMGERRWRRGDPVWQRRRLDEVRPDGAQPLQPSAAPPDFDEAFDDGPLVTGFDDLQVEPRPPERRPEQLPDPVESPIDPGLHPVGVERGDAQQVLPLDLPPVATSRRAPRSGVRIVRRQSPTPIGIVRPTLDDLPDREIDPLLMAAAMAEIDAELRRPRDQADG